MSVQQALRLASLPVAMGLMVWLSGQGLAAEPGKIPTVFPEKPNLVPPSPASRSNIGRVVKQNVAETLTEINPDDASITPRLATSWERIDDRTWRFQLREGVVFHDGTPMDAEAVATSITRTLNPNLDCEIRTKFFGNTTVTPKVVDGHTLDLVTDEPSPILPTMMGTVTVQAPSTPMDELTREPIGTGPYVFTSWTPGQDVVLTRFDDYWGETPEVEGVTFIWRAESAVGAAMVETGEGDNPPPIAPPDAARPEK